MGLHFEYSAERRSNRGTYANYAAAILNCVGLAVMGHTSWDSLQFRRTFQVGVVEWVIFTLGAVRCLIRRKNLNLCVNVEAFELQKDVNPMLEQD